MPLSGGIGVQHAPQVKIINSHPQGFHLPHESYNPTQSAQRGPPLGECKLVGFLGKRFGYGVIDISKIQLALLCPCPWMILKKNFWKKSGKKPDKKILGKIWGIAYLVVCNFLFHIDGIHLSINTSNHILGKPHGY